RVGSAARMLGQPASCGSVGEPNLRRNHSVVTGCAPRRAAGTSRWSWGAAAAIRAILIVVLSFAVCSPEGLLQPPARVRSKTLLACVLCRGRTEGAYSQAQETRWQAGM